MVNRVESRQLDLEKSNFIKVLMMLLVVFYHSMAFWMRGGWGVGTPVQPSAILGFIAA